MLRTPLLHKETDVQSREQQDAGVPQATCEEGMVDVKNRRCSHDSCTRVACFKMEGGKMVVYCSQHAEKNMVDVRGNRCRHPVCTRQASYNVEGKKTGVYCEEHDESGMTNVRIRTKAYIRRCSHDTGIRRPSWGIPTKGAPTECARHKSDLTGGLVFNFRAS